MTKATNPKAVSAGDAAMSEESSTRTPRRGRPPGSKVVNMTRMGYGMMLASSVGMPAEDGACVGLLLAGIY
jgi:hypothetical protein